MITRPDPPLYMTEEYAEKFAALALSHITREYPNKLDHVLLDASDVKGPRALHPIFYGSFDWHSCVHGYWLLARLYRMYPTLRQSSAIRALFNTHLTAANVAVEVAYASHPSRAGFERPYGWAWLLALVHELYTIQSSDSEAWCETLSPLARVFEQRFVEFLPKATYPIRTGTHFNTAFALAISAPFADTLGTSELHFAMHHAAKQWYRDDANAPAWEPGGDDFLSGTLVEALCMQWALEPHQFATWFTNFLPRITEQSPRTLFTPAHVSDRTDGKIAHLDGLNLSRAWCWRALAKHLDDNDIRKLAMLESADQHLRASLPHVAGDYMGEHWLATFALLALDA